MWLGVLGPVQCDVGAGLVEVTGRLSPALLQALAVDRDRVTGVDELVDALWCEDPPASPEKTVRNRVSLLRRHLSPALIETVGPGYRLGRSVTVDTQQLDDRSAPAAARLTLWRGDPFADIGDWPPARAAGVRLCELHAHLQEVAIAEQLDGGIDASGLVGVAEGLVEAAPFRERRWALLMRTLYLAGRQHDALRAFRRARDLLRDELGLSPGAELLAVERAILDHEPSLGVRDAGRVAGGLARRRRLIGRDADALAIDAQLGRGRFVTVTGLGGVGKTSLAADVARGRPGDQWTVDLSSVEDASGVAETLARSLRIPTGPDPIDALASWSSSAAPCLLVLDNCEHVRPAARQIVDAVLEGGSNVVVLATSRVPLGHADEVVHQLRPLERSDAIALFAARARGTLTTADAGVDRLCAALSDVPLAIELAAARSTILSPADMLRNLRTVLDGPPPGRAGQGGVVRVVAWAADALTAHAALLFRRCAVFPGGFTLEAGRAVVGADLSEEQLLEAFAELAEASLLQVGFEPSTRYRFLDLVRHRAEELLEAANERDIGERRLVSWAVTETDRASPGEVARLVVEVPNLAAAARAACRRDDTDAALRITGASWPLISAQRGELVESARAALEMPDATGHERYAQRCAELAMSVFTLRGDLAGARQHANEALRKEPEGRAAAWAIFTLGHVDGDQTYLRRALVMARQGGDPLLQFYASSMVVDNGGRPGPTDSWEIVQDADRLAAAIDEPWARILATIVRGQACCHVDPQAALVHLDRAAEMADRCGLLAYSGVARAMAGHAGPAADPHRRIERSRQGLLDAHEAGITYFTVLALARMAGAFRELGHPDRGALLAGAARARFHAEASSRNRLYHIDREDHLVHAAQFDLGATLDVAELVERIDTWMAELAVDDGVT